MENMKLICNLLENTGSEPISAELLEKSEMPNLVIIGITSAAMILLVLNAALVAWFVTRKQNKGKKEHSIRYI